MTGDHREDEANHGHEHVGMDRNALSYHAKRVYAIKELLIEKGVISEADVQRQLEYTERRSPANGAKLVARAWVDTDFKARLIDDPKAACGEMGIDVTGLNEFVVLENQEDVRHMVVCTLCSCYPRAILGRPPDWYKSFNYRSRAVVEPRVIMAECGLQVANDIAVHVHDSTADIRYLVLPLRPPGTEALNENELAQLVTRDSMIGVTDPLRGLGLSAG